jgi:signal transduction histidine kinase
VAHPELRVSAGWGTITFRLGGDDGRLAVAGTAAALGVCAVTAFGLGWRPHLVDPGARAAIETGITIAALAAAALLLVQYRRRHHLYPLLLLSAVIAVALTDFVFSALPPLIGGRQVPLDPNAAVVSQALVPLMFAVAAFSGDRTAAGRRFWRALPVGCGCVVIVGLAEIAGLMVKGAGIGDAGSTPVLSVEVAASAAFVLAGAMFVRRGSARSAGGCLMGAASFLLAAARLQAIAIPAVAADWVTPREFMRLAAYGLVLTAVYRDYVRLTRAEEEAALTAQRTRIARDLHDGLAQDLAAIAFHGQRLDAELGANHPVVLAARHALAASRRAIIDLSVSDDGSRVPESQLVSRSGFGLILADSSGARARER